jgi:hypothetical protein
VCATIWDFLCVIGPRDSPAFDTIPPLERKDKSITQGKEEQADELLQTFSPPLLPGIIDEPVHHQHLLP